MRVAQEEIFGPVLAVMPARSLDHAIEVANGIRFGLSAGICTRSLTSAYEFLNRIDVGLAMVNLPSAGVEYHVPFGGSKQSSLGMREQGAVAVDFYSEIQTAYSEGLVHRGWRGRRRRCWRAHHDTHPMFAVGGNLHDLRLQSWRRRASSSRTPCITPSGLLHLDEEACAAGTRQRRREPWPLTRN